MLGVARNERGVVDCDVRMVAARLDGGMTDRARYDEEAELGPASERPRRLGVG